MSVSAGRLAGRFLVNLLTTSGAALSTLAIPAAFADRPRLALLLLFAGTLTDSADGTLIRAFNLEDVLPQFDGKRLDEYADLVTYVVGPLAFAWGSGVLPQSPLGAAAGAVVVMASCLQFAWQRAKSDEAFWGWPSYWNILFLYAWLLDWSPRVMAVSCIGLSLTVLAPVAFVYPSKFRPLWPLTLALGLLWGGLLAYLVVSPRPSPVLTRLSLLYPLYYLGLSLVYQRRLRAAPKAPPPPATGAAVT